MESREYFTQQNKKISEFGEGTGYISSDELLSLIKDEEVKQSVVEAYNLEEPVDVELPKIDLLTNIIKDYVNRFDNKRAIVSEDNVTTSFVDNEHNDIKFTLRNGRLDGLEFDELDAIAIYDSIKLFYDSRKLTQYITYLRKEVRDKNLLESVNSSWKNYFIEKEVLPTNKMFRLIYDKKDEIYYVKALNSEKFREFGIGATFAVAFLKLSELAKQNNNIYYVSSFALSESKIEIILRSSFQKSIPELGFVHPSITIRNDDQGNASFGIYSSLEFKLGNIDADGRLHLFPNKKVGDIEINKTYQHTVTSKTFVESFNQINEFLTDVDNFENDFYFLSDAVDPDQLRAKIAEKILSRRSPFKGIKELSDLFKRENVGHVDNLAKLLQLCGQAELIDMDFDLKFQLRYIISNVLLYGKNDVD